MVLTDRISCYVQSERTFTEDELKELIESMKQEPLMFFAPPPPKNILEVVRWIPVSEQLPEDGQEVLFSTKTGRVHLGRYYNDNSVNQWYSSLDKMRAWNNVVNAWLPLPEPYKDSEKNG